MKPLRVSLCALALIGAAFFAPTSVTAAPAGDSQDSTSKPPAAWRSQAQEQSYAELERRRSNSRSLPAGTALHVQLERPLSTATNHVGDKFYGHLTEAVHINERTIIPTGSTVTGFIDRKSEPRRFAGHPSLRLRPEKLTLPNGESYAINAVVVDSGDPRRNRVNDEGRITGPAISTNDKCETVALTGTGIIAGAIVAGPVGAGIGAATGASVSAGHFLFKHHSMELSAGTVLVMELNAPIYLSDTEPFSRHQGE